MQELFDEINKDKFFISHYRMSDKEKIKYATAGLNDCENKIRTNQEVLIKYGKISQNAELVLLISLSIVFLKCLFELHYEFDVVFYAVCFAAYLVNIISKDKVQEAYYDMYSKYNDIAFYREIIAKSDRYSYLNNQEYRNQSINDLAY